jgi:hypothetical protein
MCQFLFSFLIFKIEVFIYDMFNDALSSSAYSLQRRMIGLMNNEFERIWEEAVVAQFKLQSRHLHGGTEENHEDPQPGQPVSWLIWL